MTSPVGNAISAAIDTLLRVQGVSVLYAPSGAASYTLRAARAAHNTEQIGDRPAIAAAARDYIVRAADMAAEPQPGDTITDSGQTWVVMDAGSGRVYDDIGENATARRIHTKRIS